MMGTENFFRLLSIALLGLIGFVAMPERYAEPVQVEAVQAFDRQDFGIGGDVQAALEVNQINSGNLKPYLIDEDPITVSDLDLLELDLMAKNPTTIQ